MTDRAVLFSIKPKYCELIASGKKTVEVRKTRPKIPTPFKGYIYCTKNSKLLIKDDISTTIDYIAQNGGKVIGEFICNKIEELKSNEVFNATALFSQSCLTRNEFFDYIKNKNAYYILHISDLVIYDKSKELSEFGLKRAPQSWCYVQEVK